MTDRGTGIALWHVHLRGLTDAGLEHRSLTPKGRSEATEVVVLHAV